LAGTVNVNVPGVGYSTKFLYFRISGFDCNVLRFAILD